jgi:NAD(P)H-nitrite reductase large subunit
MNEKEDENNKLSKAKQLSTTVCICKGIPLSKVLPALAGSETVSDVNRKAGTGCGGCKGERCGPRIKILLRKYKEHEGRKKE